MTDAEKWLLGVQIFLVLFAAVYLGYELLKARQENLKYRDHDLRRISKNGKQKAQRLPGLKVESCDSNLRASKTPELR